MNLHPETPHRHLLSDRLKLEAHHVTQLRFFLSSLLVGLCLLTTPASGADIAAAPSASAELLSIGQRIYREGITGSGAPLKAQTAAQTQLSGKTVACVACHRRSGYGGSEGQVSIRPITAGALFAEQTLPVHSPRIKAQLGSRQRPAYSPALLERAIRQGMDSEGKPLNPLMPRFALSDDDLGALVAYLETLSAQSSPGVDDDEIHFATVIESSVTPERRRAMLDIMQAFFKDKGANVRQNEQRREAGNMRMYRAYRKWVLHVWELNGPADTWGKQLETYYQGQPVFALLGGLGQASWKPVHDFSERFEVPVVFPQVEMPVALGDNFYNLYLSRGMSLQVDVLAGYLKDQGEVKRVVQVYRAEVAGSAAAASLRAALLPGQQVEDIVLTGQPDSTFWSKLGASKADVMVLWLRPADLEFAPPAVLQMPVYVSFELLGGKLPAILPKVSSVVRMVYPSDLSPRHESRLLRNKIWLHSKGIAITDEAVQMNTLFAMTVVSDALGHIMDSFSRDFFIERVEHAVAQTPTPSFYPGVSLGPGQRFAAKGSAVVTVQDGDKPQLKPLSGWIVP
jgi:mono/diheme cytochrome c family protein